MNLVDSSDAEHMSNPALLAALTTEHYTLQASRSSTVVEANGRSSLFLSATSAATVALALVAQLDQLGDTFLAFALVVLPALVVLGVTSYMRLADLAVQDAHYARAIGRIRAFYLTLDPAGRQYWMQPAGDDPHTIMRQAGEQHSRWHHFSHTATSVSAVTAVVSGALLGLVLSAFSPVPVAVVAVISTAVGSALFGATWLDQERRWRRSARSEPTRFLPDGTPAAQAAEIAGPTSPPPLPVPAVA
ncbi:MAG TPA: hypothetical protein VLA55_02625 [Ornithinibacter sp.]|nr:hypothetical protein [Ornithinibacter sp.]